jgi:hypothetical protein
MVLFNIVLGVFYVAKYFLSRDNPNANIESNDIAGYSLNLKSRRIKPKTAANYLHYLTSYFRHFNELSFSKGANEEKNKFVQEFRNTEKSKKRIPIRDVLSLYRNAEDKDKIIMRLLLFQRDIPIESFNKINFVKTIEGRYQFNVNNKIIGLSEETVKLAEPLLKENLENGDNRLLINCTRTMER